MEDAVAPGRKAEARAALTEAVPAVARGGDAVVRINRPLDLAVADIDAAVAAGVGALVLTKLMGPEHLRLLEEVVEAAEARHGRAPGAVRLIGLVETLSAVPLLGAIAAASPRLVALGAGREDLAAELEAEPGTLPLQQIAIGTLMAARAAGILPLGSLAPFVGLEDLEAYRAGLRRSRAMGFACASCIHPAQVAVINEEYGARPEEVERARRLVLAFETALAAGRGAVAFEGAMVDLPVVEQARALLRRAR
ncbi:aldolase/citrate lyase family protein [Roseomonas pecuniae]|uniref:Aldolase/citrate lyase family protein n=1 Tax=Roseomonas populi TaxID=3121582 RepID=A0ABT1XCX8_9PROT|nr:aldolase/citrate lyase family protein [Roseomonas pecuniae]